MRVKGFSKIILSFVPIEILNTTIYWILHVFFLIGFHSLLIAFPTLARSTHSVGWGNYFAQYSLSQFNQIELIGFRRNLSPVLLNPLHYNAFLVMGGAQQLRLKLFIHVIKHPKTLAMKQIACGVAEVVLDTFKRDLTNIILGVKKINFLCSFHPGVNEFHKNWQFFL